MIRLRVFLFYCLFGNIIIQAHAQAPVPDFTASTVAGCGPLGVFFTDKSTGNPTSWTWDLGNGQISSLQNPYVNYTQPGIYTISLIVKNANGANSIRKTDYITVYAYPMVDFKSDLQVACVPATATFTSLSTPGQGNIVSYNWDFGDGTTSNAQIATHNFANTGYYNIGLTVTNSRGCSNTATRARYIRVVPGVKPDFTWSLASASCTAPYDIKFTNQTSGPGTLTYTWDLGNGNTNVTQSNPTSTYPTDNAYSITLKATSDYGCGATTTKSISFKGNTPVITAPDTACVNSTVNFVNGSTPSPLSSAWDFGDATNASIANPDKSYAAPGEYSVTLTNTYANCSSSGTKKIVIVDKPTINFSATPESACKAPLTVNFQSLFPNGSTWQWDFGDGGTANTEKPQHTFANTGQYNVTLTASSPGGCAGSTTIANYITIVPPSINMDLGSLLGCTNSPVGPRVSYDAADGVASYQWSAPGATPSSSSVAGPQFTYTTPGTYDLTLTITTNSGCTVTKAFTGAVHIGDPVQPTFTASPLTTCGHAPVTFTATTPGASSYNWNFGDGSSGSGAIQHHVFKDSGYYSIIMTANNNGCSKSKLETKYIYVNPPMAGFKYKITCNSPLQVQFTDTTKSRAGDVLTYLWSFGDPANSTSTFANPPLFPFPANGSYTVQQVVSNGTCTDTATTTVVLQPIVTSFSVNPSVCRNQTLLLSSTSTPANAIDSFYWDIGPATTPKVDSGVYRTSIADTGKYDIVLHVIDGGGCPHHSAPVTVTSVAPSAKFVADAAGACRNNNIGFTDQSTPYPGHPIASWAINYGDANAGFNGSNPPWQHAYADTGTYKPTIFVIDDMGCADTADVTVPVRITAPKAGFFAPDTVYCPNASMPFVDSSRGFNLTFGWAFGDGSVSSDQNPTHPYANDDTYYSVKLKVTDDAGCADSITRQNYIHIHSPIAAFTMKDTTAICIPLETSFLPAAQYYDSLYWDFGDGTTSGLDTTSHFYNDFPNPGNSYTVKLTVQGKGRCQSSVSHNVYIYQPYNVTSFTFSPVTGCDSISTTFNIAPPPFTSFSLYYGDGAIDSSQNPTPTHLYHGPSSFSPQIGLMDSTGCIVAINKGSITVLGAVPFFSMTQKKFCDSGTVVFTDFTISNDPPVSLTWDWGDGSPTETGTINDSRSHHFSDPGLIPVTLKTVTNAGQCIETYTDTVHVYPTPHPTIAIDGTQCTGPVQFKGGLTQATIDTIKWDWTFSDGQKSSAQDPYLRFLSGRLTAHLQTSVSYGCKDTTSATYLIQPLPEIKGPHEITTPVGIPVTLPLTYSGGTDHWVWSPEANLSCTDCSNPAATPTFATLYTVTVTDTNSCTATDSIMVKTICNTENYFVPNTFSPNGDGVNDVFYPRGLSIYNIRSMRVFNRWGQLVFERRDFPANTAGSGWDGNFNGKPAAADTYIYIMEVICNNAQTIALKGDITLIR